MSENDAISRFLKKRRRWRRIGAVLLALLLVVSLADQFGLLGSTVTDFDRFDRAEWTVTSIIDGDTLDLTDDSNRIIRFHLLGVDAPEPGAHWHDRAKNYAMARALKKPVTIALDGTQSRDAAGNLRGYVYLNDNETLNLALIRDGQAYADRRVPHTFARAFEQAETAVRKKESGLWKDLHFNDMPSWRQEWLSAIGEARGDTDSKDPANQ